MYYTLRSMILFAHTICTKQERCVALIVSNEYVHGFIFCTASATPPLNSNFLRVDKENVFEIIESDCDDDSIVGDRSPSPYNGKEIQMPTVPNSKSPLKSVRQNSRTQLFVDSKASVKSTHGFEKMPVKKPLYVNLPIEHSKDKLCPENNTDGVDETRPPSPRDIAKRFEAKNEASKGNPIAGRYKPNTVPAIYLNNQEPKKLVKKPTNDPVIINPMEEFGKAANQYMEKSEVQKISVQVRL